MNLLKKIFSPTILTVSFLLLVYTFYRSEIFWDGDKRNYYLTYYLISSILIFFSIITFFINQNIKEYLIISGISLVVSLYLFEGYLTLTQFSKKKLLVEQRYKKQTENKWDKRSRFKIYNDLKKTNNEIVLTILPNYFINERHSIFPLSGISNSETINCNENGYYSFYKSDRYGFNNPNAEWDKKEIEYLLIGDSFTHGACVNRPNDISSVLRTLSNKAVLNLGMGSNGPLIEYATLREYFDTNIKKVLWVYFEGNDLANLGFEKKNILLVNYLNNLNFTQNLKFKQNEIDDLALNFFKKRKASKFNLIKFIKISNTRIFILPTLVLTPTSEFKKILQLAKELVEKNNSKLYFIYLPEYSRYKINYDNTNYSLIKNIVTELNIPFINIHNEVFEKEKNPLKLFPFELKGHYNVEGYKKVAETIYKFTKD
jgi:lysophospholipase L1-like esterase